MILSLQRRKQQQHQRRPCNQLLHKPGSQQTWQPHLWQLQQQAADQSQQL
jgi:hypothetical protein